MKKGLKIAGFSLLGIAAVLYAGFLFVLPNTIDLNKYKPEVQKIAQEQAKLNVDFENVKIITTPLLGAGIKAENICIKLPDNSTLFSAESFKTRISLPSLLLLTVKVSCLEVEKPFVNLEIINNENFKIAKLVEDLLNEGKEQRLEEEKQIVEAEAEDFQFNPAWIRIKVPNIKLRNYRVLVNDLKSKHYLDLKGEELRLGYFNGKVAKLKTYAEIFSDEQKNVTANIDINTFLPKPTPGLDNEDDPAERIEIPFVNPVLMYRNYDLKANLDTKLRIRNKNSKLTTFGHFYIDDITLKVSNLQLPPSYLKANTFGTNIDLDTNIYPVKDQFISLLGKINYGSHPKMDMNIKAGTINFNDMLILTRAFLDSLHIQHELNQIKAEGTLNADCYIKSNFKKIKSTGSVIVQNGGISVRNLGKVLSEGNINIKLDDNILDIRNSSILIGGAPLYIDGKIDEHSIADINVKADKIPIPKLFNAFAPSDLRKQFNLRSGNISLNLGISGKLNDAVADAKFALDNLNISNSSMIVTNDKFLGGFILNPKEFRGTINNENFGLLIPQTHSNVKLPKLNIEIANNNIDITENSILFNDKTNLKYSGAIIDYNKLKSINFQTTGAVNTDDLIKLIGREFKPYLHSQGNIPVKLTFDGNSQKQTLFAQALCDKNNFITPVDFENVAGVNTSLQTVIDFKPSRIKIKKTGLFKRNVSVDEQGNEIINLDEVFGIDGTIAGNRINLIKITMPNPMNGKIYVFPKSLFTVQGKAFVFGEASAPRLRGGYELSNLSIPELLLTLNKTNLNFRGHSAEYSVKDLLLNGSDIQVNGTLSLLPSEIINIPNLNIKSKYLNVDKLMAVSNKAMRYVPQTPAKPASQSSADIPIIIRNGSINFARIITGNINVRNTTAGISMANNVFNIRNLRTNVFEGKVSGNISMNLISTLLNIRVQGDGIDVDKAMADAAGMKNTLSGKASFDTDISLKGSTYEEQMESLKGKVNFIVKDGQFGPFGKLENLILAENIRESQFFQTALGGVIGGLTTIDTTHFSELVGSLEFKDGICTLDPITSLGNILSLHIAGEFDLLRNYADMKVRARMASLISNLLGPIGAINPANLINSAASLNVITAKAFSLFCEMIPQEEMDALPSFANKYVDNSATKFQIVVRGDVAKPLKLVKSFKWLASETEYNNAVDYVNSIPEPIEGSEATNIEDMIKEVEAEKQTVKYKLKHFFNKETEN